MTRGHRIIAVSLAAMAMGPLGWGLAARSRAQGGASRPVVWTTSHRIEDTRLLRRASLALFDRAPTVAEYESLLALPEAERREEIYRRIEEGLEGPEFQKVLLSWGIDYLKVMSYDFMYDFVNTRFLGHYSVDLERCPADTLHGGVLANLNYVGLGDPHEACDDPGVPLREVEPWWAPGTTVTVLGEAGSGVREVDGVDCGGMGSNFDSWPAPGCSCGPNLVWCFRPQDEFPDWDGYPAISARRAPFEEPARLFRHIIANDRPFSDIILGDYTVVNRGLAFLYVRNGRRNRDNIALDDAPWWNQFADDEEWREVRFPDLHPDLLSDREYRFDPRVDQGLPEGVPAAGVMSTLGANYVFARERVRAARWLEIFACREFAPPPSDVEFDAYDRDPGTEGVCQHCHQLIDPAAMHFKRMFGGGGELGGVGDWDLSNLPEYDDFRARALDTFEHDTLMTPVSEATLAFNPNAALIDFMPENYALFGTSSDGTIGPLGLAKVLVESGEFDKCVVRRVHEWVAGRDLEPALDKDLIDEYAESFVASERNIKQLIMEIVRSEEFRIGW